MIKEINNCEILLKELIEKVESTHNSIQQIKKDISKLVSSKSKIDLWVKTLKQ